MIEWRAERFRKVFLFNSTIVIRTNHVLERTNEFPKDRRDEIERLSVRFRVIVTARGIVDDGQKADTIAGLMTRVPNSDILRLAWISSGRCSLALSLQCFRRSTLYRLYILMRPSFPPDNARVAYGVRHKTLTIATRVESLSARKAHWRKCSPRVDSRRKSRGAR